MSKNKKNQIATKSSSVIDSVFRPSPALEQENSQAYEALLKSVFEAVNPSDVIERMWTWEFVGLSWEMRRYDALKIFVIKAATPQALQEILAPLIDGQWKFGALDAYDENGARRATPSMAHANDYSRGDANGIKAIVEILREANLTMKDVEEHATILAFGKLERINDLVSKLNARRNALLGEIERHRSTLAANLRRAADTVDGEFEEIEPERSGKPND